MNNRNKCSKSDEKITDYGAEPFSVNIRRAALGNKNFRTALWTGDNLQLTLMSIPSGGEIGLEMHDGTDQFIRIESGEGIVKMGSCRDKLNYQRRIGIGDAVFVPAGTWHNIMNIGRCPLKVYSVYAPPKHPHGTVHQTKEIADKSHD